MVSPSLPSIQLPEPDFCTETLPPVIDKTVRGVLAELEFPQNLRIKKELQGPTAES
jgi:hypothetical protein